MQAILAEAYFHRLDPFAIHFYEGWGLRWYGLSYLAGFAVGGWLLWCMGRTRRSALAPQWVSDFVFYLVVGVVIGGRLGYCIFYQPSLFLDPPVLGVLQLWKGGMASHGGFVGAAVAMAIFARRRGLSLLHLLDVAGLCCTPGLCFGRIANFVNAELWGKPLPPELRVDPPWWSVKYPHEVAAFTGEKLAALEPLKDLLAGSDPATRAVELAQAGNQQVIDTLRPLLTPYYPSQIFQAIADGPILFLALALVWLWPRKPGVVAGWFLLSYAVLRIATEVYRQPDLGVAVLPTPLGDLSRGQALSVLMVVVGAVLIAFCARRAEPRVGGLLWGTPVPQPEPPSDDSPKS